MLCIYPTEIYPNRILKPIREKSSLHLSGHSSHSLKKCQYIISHLKMFVKGKQFFVGLQAWLHPTWKNILAPALEQQYHQKTLYHLQMSGLIDKQSLFFQYHYTVVYHILWNSYEKYLLKGKKQVKLTNSLVEVEYQFLKKQTVIFCGNSCKIQIQIISFASEARKC